MALPVTDTFLQTSGSQQTLTTYSAAWSILEGSFNVQSGSGRCDGGGGTYNTARRNDETFSTEQYAQIEFNAAGGIYMGPAVRCQSGANSSYHVDANGSNFYVSKCLAGTQTTMAGPVSQTFATGDILRLEVTGTGGTITLKVFRALAASPTSFTQVGTDYTDSSSPITTAGYGGIFTYGSAAGVGISAFEAGDLGGGSVFTPRRSLLGVG